MGVFDERFTASTHFGTWALVRTMQNPHDRSRNDPNCPKQVETAGRKCHSAAQGQPLRQRHRQACLADLPLCLGQVVLAAAELK